MLNVSIREVDQDELLLLHKIGRETFEAAFGDQNTASDMKAYLDESYSIERIQQEFRNDESLFFFAELDEEVIGYLKVNWGEAQTEGNNNDSLEIERIYVISAFQGKKIGKVLFDKAIEVAMAKGKQSIWLGVWEKNIKAIKFYERLGFTMFGSHDFLLGSDLQTDMLMSKYIG